MKAIELINSVKKQIELAQLAKLATINSVIGSKEIYSKVKSQDTNFDANLSQFLTASPRLYHPWRDHLIQTLYFLDPSSPAPFIQDHLDNHIEPYRSALPARLASALSDIRLECHTLDVILTSDILTHGSAADRSVIAYLTSMSACIAARTMTDTHVDAVMTHMMPVYQAYGKCHSIMHFIDFVAVVIVRLLTVKQLSYGTLAAEFESKLLQYKSGNHKEILLLPFTSMSSRSKGKLTTATIVKAVKVMIQTAGDKDVISILMNLSSQSKFIVDGILSARNLVSEVINSLSMTAEETKSAYLSKYASLESTQYLSDLSQAAKDFKRHLVTFMSASGEVLDFRFNELTVHDAASSSGRVRQYLARLMEMYADEVPLAASVLRVESLPLKTLSAARSEDLIEVDIDDIYDHLCRRQISPEDNETEFTRALRFELYDRLVRAVSLQDDVSSRAFRYSDESNNRVRVMINELVTECCIEQTPLKPKLVALLNKMRESRDLLEVECELTQKLTLILSDRQNLPKMMKLVANIKLDICNIEDFYKTILLKKLDLAYHLNKTVTISPINIALQKILTSTDSNLKAFADKLLVQVASQKSDTSLLEDCRLDSRRLDIDRRLGTVPNLANLVNDISETYAEVALSTVGDILRAANRAMSEIASN